VKVQFEPRILESFRPATQDQYQKSQQPTKLSQDAELIWAPIETEIGASSATLEEKSQAARQSASANWKTGHRAYYTSEGLIQRKTRLTTSIQ
jgi:hypothetical protein